MVEAGESFPRFAPGSLSPIYSPSKTALLGADPPDLNRIINCCLHRFYAWLPHKAMNRILRTVIWY